MPNTSTEKKYTYLRGFAEGNRMKNTLVALPLSRKLHDGQFRNDGQPFISHPLGIACYATSLGLDDDVLIATILLHDVVEDCRISLDNLPVDDEVRNGVRYMTIMPLPHDTSKMETKRRYYAELLENRNAFITKALDRQYNLSDMVGTFSLEKIAKNVYETQHLLLPMFRQAKDKWPDMTNVLYALSVNLTQITNILYGTHELACKEYARTINKLE